MLRKPIFSLLLFCFLFSCSPDDNERTDNPYLIEENFRFVVNLNLPEYNNLNFPGNSYATYNYGINGVVVYNVNNNQFTAFELSDPNHPLQDCSTLTVRGVLASCNCPDGNTYNVITGEIMEGQAQYTLKPYRIRKSGNVLEVYN